MQSHLLLFMFKLLGKIVGFSLKALGLGLEDGETGAVLAAAHAETGVVVHLSS